MSDDNQAPNQVDSTTALQFRKQPQPGDVLDSIYRLDQPLGKGGVGVVFRAWHLHLQRPCAIKFLHPQLVSNPELRTRFRREAQSAFQLGHPHIVTITDFRDDPNAWPYIVMELVQGETLRDRLERGPLGAATAVRLMAELCDALQAAHRRGVIHRDLKPENLFLTQVEGQPEGEPLIKVLDFGLSKLLDGAEITGSGRLLGSPSYMSPEQARGESHLVDARSDVFSVGALLYESLTAEKLWNAANFELKRQQIVAAKLPPLNLTVRGLPPQIEQIITKACARLPEDRYQTAAALMEALNQLRPQLTNKPLSALPAPVVATPKPVTDTSSTASSVGRGELVAGSPERPKKSSAGTFAALAAVAILGAGAFVGYSMLHPGGTTATADTGGGSTVGTVTTQAPNPSVTAPDPVPTPPAAAPDLAAAPVAVVAPTPKPAEPDAPAAGPGEKPAPVELPAGVQPGPAVADSGTTGKTAPPAVPSQPGPGQIGPGKKWKPGVRPQPGLPPAPLPTPPPAVQSPEELGSNTEKAVPTVNGVMRRAMPALVRCFTGDAPLPTKISVDLTIQSDGKVSDANIDGADDQASCVNGIMKGLRFAPPTDSDSYGIHYDFVNLRR